MAQQRLPMRKIRDVLRLSAAGLSKRQIAASLGIGPTAAGACLRRAREAGVGWPLPDDLNDDALENRLYPVPTPTAKDWRSLPDWPAIHRELRRKGVTLQLVWEEYRAAHPDGYGRSWFCELYRAWEGRLSPTMRQPHVASEKLFVDYAGTTIDIVDAATGEVHACQPPRLDPGDVHRAAEVAFVLGRGEPACLAGSFAGRSSGRSRAVTLVTAVTRV